jgi:hypothetical protein
MDAKEWLTMSRTRRLRTKARTRKTKETRAPTLAEAAKARHDERERRKQKGEAYPREPEPYQERLFDELKRTIFAVEGDLSGEAKARAVIDVALSIAALAAASTALTATPSATLVYCAEIAVRLQTMIAGAKRLGAARQAGELPGGTLQ